MVDEVRAGLTRLPLTPYLGAPPMTDTLTNLTPGQRRELCSYFVGMSSIDLSAGQVSALADAWRARRPLEPTRDDVEAWRCQGASLLAAVCDNPTDLSRNAWSLLVGDHVTADHWTDDLARPLGGPGTPGYLAKRWSR